MKNGFKFSIIVPVYNVELYLKKCINSVLRQTYGEYELILIDDGSTDRSGVICDEFAKKDERICVIHQSNFGLSSARNKGIDSAKGDYLIFLDSDDYWYNDQVLDKINARLNMNHADVLSFNYIKFTGQDFEKPYFSQINDMPRKLLKKETLKYQIENDLWIACAWNKVVKRELFSEEKLRFKLGITSEDIDWCLRLAQQANYFDYISDVVVCYRQRLTSISKHVTVNKIDMLISNIESCLDILEQNYDKAKLLRSYISYQYGTAVYLVSTIEHNEEYKRLLGRLNKSKYVLKWSKNKKIRMIYIMNLVGGFNLVILLLRLREKIR